MDPNGALYKVDGGSAGNNGFNPIHGLTGFLKRTRLDEGNAALQELANALNENLPQETRAQYLYDHVDIYSIINYLAGTSIIHNADHLGKNHYIYQDTEGTGKWSFIPWDLDLTFGKNGANTPDVEVYDADETNQSSSRYPNSHPFFGSSEYPRFGVADLYNRLIDAVLDTPELREMYLRRLRSAMDEILQSPLTPESELKLEARLAELLPLIQNDWTLDDAKWIEAPQTNLSRGTDWGEDLPLATHFQRIIDRYLEPRRNHLYNTHNAANAPIIQRLVETQDPLNIFVPNSSDNITGWQNAGFDDSGWTNAQQGIGYDRNGGYSGLIGTNVESELYNMETSVLTRTKFTIASAAELNSITTLFLNARYDDGFIAYLNGVEIVRSGSASGSGYSSTASSHEATGVEQFVMGAAAVGELIVGENVLAIQGINIRTSSSDMLLHFSLTGTNGGDPEIAGIPNAQVGNPQIDFDESDFDASPISGNQKQEYLRLNNSNSTAVDISGWRLSGGISLTFRPGTVIPAGGELFAVASVQDFLSRSTGPSSGQNLLTHGDFSGQLGFEGELIRLIAADGQIVDEFQVPATTGTDLQSFLRVSEISYHANTSTGAEEFIEFTNISSGGESTNLDLSGVRISQGPSTPFVFPAGTILAPGARLLVVKDTGAFQARYPSVSTSQIVGQFGGSLANGGETVRVEDDGNNTVFEFEYGDSGLWPIEADGRGATLELVNETGTPYNQLSKHYSWRASVANGGTPGTSSVAPSGIVINEILAHTDLPAMDAIELYNPTNSSIDVSGWFLSDSGTTPFKYQIPAGTTLSPGAYVVFDESDFNPTPSTSGFALSSTGDQVYLTRNDNGTPAFEDVVEFNATFNGESIGRLSNGSGRLARLAETSFGTINGRHQVSDLILSEVHYNPLPPTTGIAGIGDNDMEFVEIFNPNNAAVALDEWRLRGEVDFEFVTGTIPGRSAIVVVPFDPSDTDRLNVFRSHHGIGTDVTIVGGYSGNLSNSFGRVTLQRSDTPPPEDPTAEPFVNVDEFVYDDLAPFENADDNGLSLNRKTTNAFGNYANSWSASSPSPGATTLSVAGIESRQVFYNNSSFDGNGATVGVEDDLAIGIGKFALLPGQTASFSNYTSYTNGLNGFFIDVSNLPKDVELTSADFSLAMGNGSSIADFTAIATPFEVSTRRVSGANSGDRVSLTIADGAVRGTWLQVTLLANANTRLTANDVFYFGNSVGETGDSASDAAVTGSDVLGTRANRTSPFTPAGETNRFDFNRDQRVDGIDVLAARSGRTSPFSELQLITAPAGSSMVLGFSAFSGSGQSAGDNDSNGTEFNAESSGNSIGKIDFGADARKIEAPHVLIESSSLSQNPTIFKFMNDGLKQTKILVPEFGTRERNLTDGPIGDLDRLIAPVVAENSQIEFGFEAAMDSPRDDVRRGFAVSQRVKFDDWSTDLAPKAVKLLDDVFAFESLEFDF